MNEIRVRPRQVLFLVILFSLLLWYVSVRSKSNCILSGESIPKILLNLPNDKIIYAITPTYYRPAQLAELTRLSHVILLVPNIHWIIVEDALNKSSLVQNLITRSGLTKRSTLLNTKTPDKFKLKPKDQNWMIPRGAAQRNLALQWILQNVKENEFKSFIYFMDDDNTYSIELFNEILLIEPLRVGVWPVGLVGGLLVEKPLTSPDTKKVVGFNALWHPERQFPIDMAGFAISTALLFKYPNASFSYKLSSGLQETELLRQLTVVDNLQPLANKCTKIYVWHTRTEKTKLNQEIKLNKQGKRSDDGIEY